MRSSDIAADLSGDLRDVMKSDSRHLLHSLSIPLLEICMNEYAPEDPLEDQLSGLLRESISRLRSLADAQALKELFLGPDRWQPLAVRGPKAASALGITYDTLRRRDQAGIRRLDLLVVQLAESILTVAPLGELISTSDTPDPGANVFDRASVFISYSTTDDKHEGGLVSNLRDQLVSEFRFQTGQDLFVFLDSHSIEMGENWRRRLNTGIEETTLLLVFLTPSYLRSKSCRSELESFLEGEHALGRDDLVLPIYYASVAHVESDPLASVLLERQYVDWRDLRFLSFDSVPVREAVSHLASSVARALARSDNRDQAQLEHEDEDEDEDEGLGLVEQLSEMQLAMPRLVRTMYQLIEEQEGVTSEVKQATMEIEKGHQRGLSGAARLLTSKRLARRLDPYATRMESASEAIQSDLHRIDGGMRALATAIPSADEEGIEESVSDMTMSLATAERSSEQAAAAIESLAASYSDVGRKTSTLRPVLTRLIASSRIVGQCQESFSKWIEMLEAAVAEREGKRTGS